MLFQVLGLWLYLNEIFLGLGLTVIEINITKVQKQEITYLIIHTMLSEDFLECHLQHCGLGFLRADMQ